MSRYVCHEVKIEVDGPEGLNLSVQAFELNAAVNTIPTVTLNILPVQFSPGYTATKANEPRTVSELYSELLSRVGGPDARATATIKLTVKNMDTYDGGDEFNPGDRTEGLEQTVTLHDWVLTDVGLSSVSAMAAPMLVVVFSHPVVHLDRTGAIYEDLLAPSQLDDEYLGLGGSDVVEVMDEVYEMFSAGADGEGQLEFFEINDEYEDKVKSFRRKLTEYLPSDYLKCLPKTLFLLGAIESGDIDLSGDPEGLDEMIRAVIAYEATPEAFGSSTWRRLLNVLCPDLMLQVVPTYHRIKLQLEPFSPWQKCSRVLMSDMVASMDMSPMDPDPIIGTAMDRAEWDPDMVVGGATRDRDPEDTEEGGVAFYFPDRARSEDVVGRILFVRPNSILRGLRSLDWGAVGSKVGGATSLEDAENGIDDQTDEDLGKVYAKAMFLCNYRDRCRIKIGAIPMFYDAFGKPLYPGRVLTVCKARVPGVSDPEAGCPYFYGYLSQMTIKGDASGHASMSLSLSYARPPGQMATLVDEGTENPCYPPLSSEDRDE